MALLVQFVDEFKSSNASDISEKQYLGIMNAGILNATLVEEIGLQNCTIEEELDQVRMVKS